MGLDLAFGLKVAIGRGGLDAKVAMVAEARICKYSLH